MSEIKMATRQRLGVIKIIIGALAAGVTFLGIIALVLTLNGDEENIVKAPEIMELAFGVIAFNSLFLWFAIPYFMSRKQCAEYVAKELQNNPDKDLSFSDVEEEFVTFLQTECIIRGAMVEGAGMILGVGTLISGNILLLAGVPVLIAFILLTLKPAFSFEAWVNENLRRGKEMASMNLHDGASS